MKAEIKSQNATAKNVFIPTTYSLKRKMDWWRNQSTNEDKGGNFNLELYLDYLAEQEFNEIPNYNEKV